MASIGSMASIFSGVKVFIFSLKNSLNALLRLNLLDHHKQPEEFHHLTWPCHLHQVWRAMLYPNGSCLVLGISRSIHRRNATLSPQVLIQLFY